MFVGAGASISSGMPSWSKALNQIGKRLGEEHIDYQKALELPQNYFDQRGKKEYILEELATLGINRSFIYPDDYSMVAGEIKEKFMV